MMVQTGVWRFGGAALLAPVLLVGCKCEEEKPYTPFTVGSALPVSSTPAESASSAPAVDAGAPKFAARPAEVAPPKATRWQIADRTLEAPPQRAFERAIVADFDGDGAEDVAPWLVRADEQARINAGELWLYPAQGAPKKLADLPGFVPTGPGCQITTVLTQTGPKTVTLDTTGSCTAKLIARTPLRSLMVLAPAASNPVLVALRIAEPAAGETLTFSVDSSDHDGDQLDDVTVTAELTHTADTRAANAALSWFQRGSSALREAGEPGRSFARRASTEAVRAKTKKTAASARSGVNNIRRLMASLCAESGAARVFDRDGSPLGCGSLNVTVDRLAEADVTAALSLGDVLEATGALSHASWYFGTISEGQRKALSKSIEKATTVVGAADVPASVRAKTASPEPRWSPLAFTNEGTLLVQTDQELVQLSNDGSPQPFPEGATPAAWPLEVRSEQGRRWTGYAHACDRSELLLTFSPIDVPPEPVRLLAARPGPCLRAQSVASPRAIPLAFSDRGVEAFVGGSHVGAITSLGEAPLRPRVWGSPRSPDGKRLVLSTPLGVLVLGGERAELWRVDDDVTKTAHLQECAVDNGATRVACLDQNAVRLLRRR